MLIISFNLQLLLFFCMMRSVILFSIPGFPQFPKISGFYGLIGPNIDKKTTTTLFDLFTGDGIIHGVFIEDGKIFPVKYLIETEKIKYENEHNNKFSKNYMMMLIYMMLYEMKLLPNVLGLSNTAFLDNNIKGDGDKKVIMTTFERDKPYEIQLDFKNKYIETISKVNIDVPHFSGHSKYDTNLNKIYTIDYDVVTNKINYFEIDQTCRNILVKKEINTVYIPIIHDFMVFDNSLIFTDSPFVWNFLSKIPVFFQKFGKTYINIYNLTTNKHEKYTCNVPGFYIFHYADIVKKDENILEIYGAHYDNIDFSSLDIEGKYRKIILNRSTQEVIVEKNEELEKMNLDFPIKWREYVLLRKLENKKIDEFVLCKDLEIIKKIKLPKNRYLCGEPSIVEFKSKPYVLGIVYDDDDNGYFFLFHIFDLKNTYVEKSLGFKPTIGFHSIFTTNG